MKKEKKAKPETVSKRFNSATANPREVEGYLRDVVRRAFGDEVENQTNIFSKRGYYAVYLSLPNGSAVNFDYFRKKDAPRMAKAIRALAAA